MYRSILQPTKTVVEKFINFTSEYNVRGYMIIFLPIFEIICIDLYFNTLKKGVNQSVISTYGYSLISIIEIIIIVSKAHGKSANYKWRQISAFTAPLLFSVPFYKLFINIYSDQRNCLFFKVAWLKYSITCHSFACKFSLRFNFSYRFSRSDYTPHLIERVHVERQIIKLAFEISQRAIRIPIELDKRIDEVPYRFIVGVEYMRAVFMDIYIMNILTVNIPAKMRTLVYDKTFFPMSSCEISECRSKKSRSDYQIIIHIF